MYADSSTSSSGSPFSPAIFMAIPNKIENTTIAIIFSFDNSLLKSLTVSTFTVLSKIFKSSVSVVSAVPLCSSNSALIFAPSSVFTSLNEYVDKTPTRTETNDITINTQKIVIIIFPNLLGCLIFAIDVVILRNISGTITTNSKFRKISPKGFKTAAFSLNAIPTIAPIIIAAKSIITDLYVFKNFFIILSP